MVCLWCANKRGYELMNYHGKIGSYYDNKCKHCGHSFCSAIMHECNASKDGRKYEERSTDGNAYVYSEVMGQCNQSHWTAHNNHIDKSSDGQYWVYSEEYIRSVIKEGM